MPYPGKVRESLDCKNNKKFLKFFFVMNNNDIEDNFYFCEHIHEVSEIHEHLDRILVVPHFLQMTKGA